MSSQYIKQQITKHKNRIRRLNRENNEIYEMLEDEVNPVNVRSFENVIRMNNEEIEKLKISLTQYETMLYRPSVIGGKIIKNY